MLLFRMLQFQNVDILFKVTVVLIYFPCNFYIILSFLVRSCGAVYSFFAIFSLVSAAVSIEERSRGIALDFNSVEANY